MRRRYFFFFREAQFFPLAPYKCAALFQLVRISANLRDAQVPVNETGPTYFSFLEFFRPSDGQVPVKEAIARCSFLEKCPTRSVAFHFVDDEG